MLESKIRAEISTALAGMGFRLDVFHMPDNDPNLVGAGNRPDLIVMSGSKPNIFVEVKKVGITYRKNRPYKDTTVGLFNSRGEIPNRQRKYLDHYMDMFGYGHVWLAIGTFDELPRRIWLIPWEHFYPFEKQHLDLLGHTEISTDPIPGRDQYFSLSETFGICQLKWNKPPLRKLWAQPSNIPGKKEINPSVQWNISPSHPFRNYHAFESRGESMISEWPTISLRAEEEEADER